MCHEAGFPAAPNYNDPDFDFANQQRGVPGSNGNIICAVGREETLKALFKTPLMYPPHSKTLYSDADYMLAGFIVEKVTGQRLDAYLKENIYTPLDLKHITYLPLDNGFAPDDCAATELNGNTRDNHVSFPGVRTETLRGQVHDERAWYCMEGVSGHAGLFASATDLAKLASAMLTGGYGDCRLFSRNVMDGFTAPKAYSFGQWGLGWWRQGDEQRPWYYGTQASSGTFGHQGWTGTLAMVDPSRELVVVYLTNKINSPVLIDDNLNKFVGGCFTAATLGFVPQILSIGMDEGGDISAQLLDLLADMAEESLGKIPEGAGADHPYVQNAVSKFGLLKKWAEAAGNGEYVQLAEEALDNF
jgi:CubicO group peptidase (beta-lactamase class C family)